MFVASMNVGYGDVMSASADVDPHTCNVQFRAGQSYVPEVHLETLLGGFRKKARDGIPAEGGLESKIQALFNRLSQ